MEQTLPQYTYDQNGNMLSDANKTITNITYNHLNLPTTVTFSGTNKKIDYFYDAVGTKLKKVVTDASSLITTEYAENYVYEGGVLQFFSTAEGYVEPKGLGWEYVFQYKDHLGNIRLSYADSNGDGVITASSEIREENNYYPFGLKHKGYNNAIGGSRDHKYGFGNKEEQDELGLGWIDITARNYDPALGRWMNLDPLAELMRRHSPYNYVFNNPLRFIDPDGMGPLGDFFNSNGKYLGSDGKNDGKIYISSGDKNTFLTSNNKEVSGGLSSLSAIRSSLLLTNSPSTHPSSPDTSGGQHEVRVDVDKDSNSQTITEGGKVTVDETSNVANGQVGLFDLLWSGVDASKSEIVGHSHPTKTIVEGENSFTFRADKPTEADFTSFKNQDINFISGNLESKEINRNTDGSISNPNNKQGAVFYDKEGNKGLTIDINAVKNILSNYENGKLIQN